MKIILLNPPPLYPDGSPISIQIHHPPLGLLNIAAVLERAGYAVTVCDASINSLDFAQIRTELRQGYDIIGITTLTATRDAAYLCAAIAKEENPDSLVVMGGPHVTFIAETTLKMLPQVDVVVRGEGELTMLELVPRVSAGESYRDIKGISYRDNQGQPRSNPDRAAIDDLTSLPFPAWHLVPMHKYFDVFSVREFSVQKPCTVVMTSRGCPGNCSFCSNRAIWGIGVRRRTVENVIEEIRFLHDHYGVKDIHFLDDTFTFNKGQWCTRFCEELLRSKMGITWRCQGRVDTVNPELLAAMKKAGCYFICFGVESASQKMQKSMRKGITAEQASRAIKLTRDAGILVGADFIIGLPGEEAGDREETFEFIRRNPVNTFTLNLPWIFPGTALHQTALDEGKVDDMTWFRPSRPLDRLGVQLLRPFYLAESFHSEEEAIRLLQQKTSELTTLGYLIRRIGLERHRLLSFSHLLHHAPATLLAVIRIMWRKLKWSISRKHAA